MNDILNKPTVLVLNRHWQAIHVPTEDLYREGTDCLAYGVCGEIRHNGDVQLCSDSYGNPDYTIGNLFRSELKTILQSDERRAVLKRINEKRCYQACNC